MIEHVIPEGVRSIRLSRYIARAWPMLKRHEIDQLFRKKDVKVNGARRPGDALVSGGDALFLYIREELTGWTLDVLYRDENLVVAVKPQGLPVDVDEDGIGCDTFLARLNAIAPGARLCHRLDAQTGGVLIAALNDSAYDAVVSAFRDHAVEKKYIALVRGTPEGRSGVIRNYLRKDRRNSLVEIVRNKAPGSAYAESRWRTVFPGKVSRMELMPVTGRTHQLRVHMAGLGHPILGDDKYGDRDFNRRHPGGLRLWCESVEFQSDCELLAQYRGKPFVAPAPEWKEKDT